MKKLLIALPTMPIMMGILLGSKSFRTLRSTLRGICSQICFDCDDSNEMHYPGADEYCDEIDNIVMVWSMKMCRRRKYLLSGLDNDNYGLTEIFFQALQEPSGYRN